jgi:hypothetical protein
MAGGPDVEDDEGTGRRGPHQPQHVAGVGGDELRELLRGPLEKGGVGPRAVGLLGQVDGELLEGAGVLVEELHRVERPQEDQLLLGVAAGQSHPREVLAQGRSRPVEMDVGESAARLQPLQQPPAVPLHGAQVLPRRVGNTNRIPGSSWMVWAGGAGERAGVCRA